MDRTHSNSDIALPKSADVARRIYRNAAENRLLRSLHRLLVQLENSRDESPAQHLPKKSGGAQC